MHFNLSPYRLKVEIFSYLSLEAEMNANQLTHPQKDRWSYLWLAIAELIIITIWVVGGGRIMKHNLLAQ